MIEDKLQRMKEQRASREVTRLLGKLQRVSFYDICIVREMAEALDVECHTPTYDALNQFHCKPYSSFTNEELITLSECTLEFLGLAKTVLESSGSVSLGRIS